MTPLPFPYKRLVEDVRKIDPAAAKWLEEELPKRKSSELSGDLMRVMDWRETPQGWEYWDNINTQIESQKDHDV